MKKYIIVVIVALILFGCSINTTVPMECIVNPDYQPRILNKVMILLGGSNLELRTRVERGVAQRFMNCTTQAIPSINIFSPLKSYTLEEIQKVIEEQQFDAIITVEPTDINTNTITLPGYSTTSTYGYAFGNYLSGSSSTTYIPPRQITHSFIKFQVNIYDTHTGMLAFVALTKEGISLASDEVAILTDSLIQHMAAYGLTNIIVSEKTRR